MTTPRILHVTDRYGGGVGRAVDNIARLLPTAEHHLLWSGEDTPTVDRGYTTMHALPRQIFAAIPRVHKTVNDLNPDVVYAHSSWAGVFTRAFRLKTPVVYQPHCYKFDDGAQHAVVRKVFFAVESRLAGRAAQTIVLSPHEEALAKALDPESNTRFIPNSATIFPDTTHQPTGFALSRTVIMNGRIAPQKDPEFFAAVAVRVRAQLPDVQFRWIGDGDARLRTVLTDAGVEVTGWVSGDALASELAKPSLYFHSAHYEGFPLSVLDAAAFEHPIAVRSIPAFDGLSIPQAKTVGDAAALIIKIFTEAPAYESARAATRLLNTTMSIDTQRAALVSLLKDIPPET